MRFEEKYPNAQHLEEPESLILCCKGSPPSKCWHCGTMTVFVEISFEAPLCSEECVDAKWKEYEEACRKSDANATARSLEVREPQLPGNQETGRRNP